MKAQFLYKSATQPFNALEVKTTVPTNRWLLMTLGTGQLGPADGSQITELDDYGYHRNLGFETDFNIFVPQAVNSYGEFEKTIFDYMINRYGQSVQILPIGHSLGARQVIEWITKYQNNTVPPQVKGFMPIAGAISGSTPIWSNCYDLPVLGVHGELDTAISFYQTRKLILGLNSWPDRIHKAQFKLVPGATHNSIMSEVFKYDKNTEYYKFIMSCWEPEVEQPIECDATLDRANNRATFYLNEGPVTYTIS